MGPHGSQNRSGLKASHPMTAQYQVTENSNDWQVNVGGVKIESEAIEIFEMPWCQPKRRSFDSQCPSILVLSPHHPHMIWTCSSSDGKGVVHLFLSVMRRPYH